MRIGYDDRNDENSADNRQKKCEGGEESQRFVASVKSCDCTENLHSVTVSVQLGLAAFGAVSVFDNDIFYAHIFIDGVDAHLSFDLKSF